MCIIMCMHDLYAYVHVIDVISSTLTFIIFKECIFVCVCVGGGGGGYVRERKNVVHKHVFSINRHVLNNL